MYLHNYVCSIIESTNIELYLHYKTTLEFENLQNKTLNHT